MSKPLLSKEQIETGYDSFLAQHPEASARVKAVSLELADALGSDLGELRRVEAATALGESAASRGIDCFEYLLRFAVDTESEREQIMQARRESIEQAIGLR